MENKLRVVRFIPIVVVEYIQYGFLTLETSGCLYEDVKSARECLASMLESYSSFADTKVIRSSITRKVFEL